nr:MAG TPA: hypothetical protein [Caudoviricetes sp.]
MSWREQVRRVDISLYHNIVECESSSSPNYRWHDSRKRDIL